MAIPTLLDADYEYFDPEYRYGLITSWVGVEYSGNYLTLPLDALVQALDLVRGMHHHGVGHGDVRPENMQHNATTGTLFLFDFSHAATRSSIGAVAFENARQADLGSLQEFVGFCETPEAKDETEWAADWVRRARVPETPQ